MISGSKLPPMLNFDNIIVVPAFSDTSSGNGAYGPIWPNWDEQVAARHCRNNIPTDKCPDTPDLIEEEINEPMVWGGVLHRHYGHFVSEIAPRILQSIRDGSSDQFLYAVDGRVVRSGSWKDVPGHFPPIAEWYGLQLENIKFCRKTIRVKHLEVAIQAEQIGSKVPCDEYLDLVDQNVERNKLSPKNSGLIYVSRASMAPNKGGHAGANYLDSVLTELGIRVFKPEQFPLKQQLETFAGADAMIFAEGSALHGLQMLGRNLGSVGVLNRRKRGRLAYGQLLKRCEAISHFDAIDEFFSFYNAAGVARHGEGVATFDVDLLFRSFNQFGVSLEKYWDAAKYKNAVEEDLKLWISSSWQFLKRRGYPTEQKELVELLTISGHEEAAAFARETIA